MVRAKQQPQQSTIPTHPVVQARIKKLGGTLATCNKTRRVEQDTQNRHTDRGDMPRPVTMVIYSDTTDPSTLGPKPVNGVRRRCFTVWPNIEEPRTCFASPTR